MNSAPVQFFERFRTEIARYAEGVHRLGPPAAPEAVRGLPGELASFLRSFDGAELFIDALTLYPAAELEREDDLLVFGATATGDRVALDLAHDPPPVLIIEEDTGEALVEGTSFARWIEGWVAAEGTLVDREGEFKEGAFDEDEPSARAAETRERRALRADPEAPAPAWRLARALVRQGKRGPALAVLRELTARTPRFPWAWFDLGKLLRAEGELAEAEAAFVSAADADPAYEHAGYFRAHAARVAVERGDEPARRAHAEAALALDAGVGRAQREAARTLLDEERGEEAREAAEVAAALLPRDLDALDVLRRARAAVPVREKRPRSPRPAPPARPSRRRPR